MLALGAKQLFLGEVQTGQSRFSALYGFLAREVRGRERGTIAVCVLHMQTRLSSLIPHSGPAPLRCISKRTHEAAVSPMIGLRSHPTGVFCWPRLCLGDLGEPSAVDKVRAALRRGRRAALLFRPTAGERSL